MPLPKRTWISMAVAAGAVLALTLGLYATTGDAMLLLMGVFGAAVVAALALLVTRRPA